jgi:hypothetical protein
MEEIAKTNDTKTNDTKPNEECIELKNIKYKTMLLKGTSLRETKSANDLNNLDLFLENEKNNNNNEPWCKLNKTVKTKKLLDYVETYKTEKNLDLLEEKILVSFLKDCLDKKKLLRVKDVIYDKEKGLVKDIPALSYTKLNKHFTLKNIDKRVSTLKSLTVKKGARVQNGKINNEHVSDSESDEIENNLC